MLTTYMRQTASDYLRAVLEAPLTEALDFIGEGFTTKITMIDSAGNQKSSSTAGANTSSDESRIIKACAVLLDAILSSKALMPRNLRLLCRYIKTEVEHISKYPPPFSVPDEEGSPEGPNSQAVRPPSVRWEQEQQPSILSAKSTSAPGKLDGIDAFDSHSHNNQSPVSSLPIPAIANNSSSTTGAGVDFDNLQRTPPISALPTATVADQSSQLQKQHHHGQEPPLLAEQQQQQQQQRPRQNSPLVLWERVVSTFLFLRLIVPGKSIHCYLSYF
jgi:hypothetical protein